MKKITAEQLFNLEYGDSVYLINKSFVKTFRYVARIPSSERYLIFSSGEILKYVYVNQDSTFEGNWYIGDLDYEFCIKLRITEVEEELKTLKSELNLKNKTQ